MIINNLNNLFNAINSDAKQTSDGIRDIPEDKKTEFLEYFYNLFPTSDIEDEENKQKDKTIESLESKIEEFKNTIEDAVSTLESI